MPSENNLIAGMTRPNCLFLSAAAQANHKLLTPVHRSLEDTIFSVVDFQVPTVLQLLAQVAKILPTVLDDIENYPIVVGYLRAAWKPLTEAGDHVDPDVHKSILAAAAKEGVSLSAWMTEAARDALKIRAGLEAVAEWEKEHGAFTQEELNEARRRVRAQLRTPRTVRRPA